jgi:dGTPase
VDDGLQAEVFRIADLEAVPLIGPALAGVRADYPAIDDRMLRLEGVRRMIGVMVNDVITEARRVAAEENLSSPEDVRSLGRQMIRFSPPVFEDLSRLRAFLHERMYRHYRVNRSRSVSRRIIAQMFQLFMSEPDVLPGEWSHNADALADGERARLVCDYIAGMTDRFAIEEHRKLFRLDA